MLDLSSVALCHLLCFFFKALGHKCFDSISFNLFFTKATCLACIDCSESHKSMSSLMKKLSVWSVVSRLMLLI